jgi:diamine N-acetyltransferase
MRLNNDEIRLVPYEPEMWPYIYAWQLSGDYDYFFCNAPVMNSVEINSHMNGKNIVFVITKASNVKEIMGMATISRIEERHRNAFVGTLIDNKHFGRKHGVAASIMLLDYLLNQMNFYKAICTVRIDNVPAIKCVGKLGMTKEAELKHEIYQNGSFHDVIRYCVTKSNFNKLHKKSGKEVSA